jgi:putative acetyltransferase
MDRSEVAMKIEIREMATVDDATAFRTLNEEWITKIFSLEAKDIEVLDNPQQMIVDKGGRVFVVSADGETVGCVALIPIQGGVYELSKMAVSPKLRGMGIGRRLIEYAIAQARELGAQLLFLGSSTKLPNAVHLYETVGFQHVPPERLPPNPYVRANVFMEMALSVKSNKSEGNFIG